MAIKFTDPRIPVREEVVLTAGEFEITKGLRSGLYRIRAVSNNGMVSYVGYSRGKNLVMLFDDLQEATVFLIPVLSEQGDLKCNAETDCSQTGGCASGPGKAID